MDTRRYSINVVCVHIWRDQRGVLSFFFSLITKECGAYQLESVVEKLDQSPSNLNPRTADLIIGTDKVIPPSFC
jgi:hypothetical protein